VAGRRSDKIEGWIAVARFLLPLTGTYLFFLLLLQVPGLVPPDYRPLPLAPTTHVPVDLVTLACLLALIAACELLARASRFRPLPVLPRIRSALGLGFVALSWLLVVLGFLGLVLVAIGTAHHLVVRGVTTQPTNRTALFFLPFLTFAATWILLGAAIVAWLLFTVGAAAVSTVQMARGKEEGGREYLMVLGLLTAALVVALGVQALVALERRARGRHADKARRLVWNGRLYRTRVFLAGGTGTTVPLDAARTRYWRARAARQPLVLGVVLGAAALG